MTPVILIPLPASKSFFLHAEEWNLPPPAVPIPARNGSSSMPPPDSPLRPGPTLVAASCAEEARKLRSTNDTKEAFYHFLQAASHLNTPSTKEEDEAFYLYLDKAIECFHKLRREKKPIEEPLQFFEQMTQEWINGWSLRKDERAHQRFFEKMVNFYDELNNRPQMITYALQAAAARGWFHEKTLAHFRKALASCFQLEDAAEVRAQLQKIGEKAMSHYQTFSLAIPIYVNFWEELALACRHHQLSSLAAQCSDLAALCHLANIPEETQQILPHWLQAEKIFAQCIKDAEPGKEIAYYEKRIYNYWTPLLYQFLYPHQRIDWASFVLNLYEQHPQYTRPDQYRNNLKNQEFGKETPQNSEVKPTPPKTDSSSCFDKELTPYEGCIKKYCSLLQNELAKRDIDWTVPMSGRTHAVHWLLNILFQLPTKKRQLAFSLLQTLGPTARHNEIEIEDITKMVANQTFTASIEEVEEASSYLCSLQFDTRDDANLMGQLMRTLFAIDERHRNSLYALIPRMRSNDINDYTLATCLSLWEKAASLPLEKVQTFCEELWCILHIAEIINTWSNNLSIEQFYTFLEVTDWVRESLVNWLPTATEKQLELYLQNIERVPQKDPDFLANLRRDIERLFLLKKSTAAKEGACP